MNDIRRTILWVIFGFSMVLLWDKWQVHNGNKATFFPSPAAVGAAAPQPERLGAAGRWCLRQRAAATAPAVASIGASAARTSACAALSA
jgi:YidC/Oxa1 family membrane protein insertase